VGTATPCVLTSLIGEMSENKDAPPHIDEYIRNTVGAAYAAGADTVSIIIFLVFNN
jgi:hypothetical protein